MKDVVAIGAKSLDASKLGEPPIGPSACQHGDELDGVRDQGTRHGGDGFLDQLLHSVERTERRASVNCTDPTGVTGSPGFQQPKGLGSTHLTDRDAIWAQAQ